jgi:hypothetical protein
LGTYWSCALSASTGRAQLWRIKLALLVLVHTLAGATAPEAISV